MKNIPFYLLTFILFTSCFKTTEDIEREKKVEQLSVQTVDSQKLLAAMTLQTRDVQSKLSQMNGQIEETLHANAKSADEKNAKLQSEIDKLSEEIQTQKNKLAEQAKTITEITDELKEHRTFIGQVAKSISKESSKSKKSEETGTPLENALSEYNKKNYKKAKGLLLELMNEKNILPKNHAKMLFHLGMIEFKDNKYKDALVYFSKFYTKWPTSSFAASTLFHIGKCLAEMGENEQAKESFNEMINNFPKSGLVKAAKKEIEKL